MKKLILAFLVITLFCIVFWWGGNAPELQGIPGNEYVVEHESVEEKSQPLPEQNSSSKPEIIVNPAPKTVVEELTCTLTVRCDTILNNIDWLDPEKLPLIPETGIIYSKQGIVFNEGDSVFDVLLNTMQSEKMHMEFVKTPAYDSVYIEGINNLYEFDCGELSGWMYKVNGVFPNYGCSQHKLSNGDVIEFVYTCDFGKDVGGNYFAQRNE